MSYRRGLDDSAGLDNLLLVELGTGTVKVADNGGHTSLVTHGGGEVDRLLSIVLGEAVGFACQFSLFANLFFFGQQLMVR